MKKLLIFFMLLMPALGFSQGLKLSDQAEISIITCGPGESLDALFGHNAIRIYDPVWGINAAYDYGRFDFSTPNFYFKFTRGKLLYEVGKRDYNRFVKEYQYYNRWVYEQVLDLDSLTKQSIYDFLEWNILPENKKYKYDFFFDNCSTIIRDIIQKAIGDGLYFSGDHLTKENSFRDLLREKNHTMPWISFGMDLALGAPIDPKATTEEHMFLPDYILSGFDNATISKDGISRPLVKSKRMVFQPVETRSSSRLITPMVIFSVLALLVVGITLRDYKSKTRSKILDFILFLTTGILGIVVVFLWVGTDHEGMKNNLNVSWAFAPNIYVAFILLRDKTPKWLRTYTRLLFIFLIMMVLIWVFGIQIYSAAMIPFMLLLAVRYFFLWQKGLK